VILLVRAYSEAALRRFGKPFADVLEWLKARRRTRMK
jgi:hypothetical protein